MRKCLTRYAILEDMAECECDMCEMSVLRFELAVDVVEIEIGVVGEDERGIVIILRSTYVELKDVAVNPVLQ